MKNKRTEKKRWPSRYSPGNWVTGAQYIIEMVCEKYSEKENKELPAKFWQLPEWESFYKSQLRATHKLLKKYEERAIINALKNRNIWSIRPNWVEKIIAQEQKKIDHERKKLKTKNNQVQKDKENDTIELKNKRERIVEKNTRSNLFSLDD